jgi:hypothetical protein
MNNGPGRGPGPRLHWPRRAKAAGVITIMAGAMLAAACSGSPPGSGSGGSPTAGGSANFSSGVAYSRCVRSHGVPNFPDPESNGQFNKRALIYALREVSDSLAKAATAACASLYPTRQENSTVTAQEQHYYLRAAACMRSHGFPAFPDPTFPGGHVTLPRAPSSIDIRSRQFKQAAKTCTKLIPAGLPYSGNSASGG